MGVMRAPAPGAVRYGWVVVGLCLVAIVPFALFRWGLGVFFPFIQEDLGTSRAELGLIRSGLALGVVSTAVLAGWLVDVVGARLLLTASLVGSAVGVILFSQIQSPMQGVLLGILMGAVLSILGPAYIKAVMDWVTPKTRALAIGISEASIPASGIIAAVLISYLAVSFGWRSTVVILGVATAVSSVVFVAFYRDKPVIGDTDARTRIRTRGRLSQVARNWRFWVSALYGATQSGVQVALISFLVLFLKEELDMSTVLAGTCLAFMMAGSALGRFGWGLVSDLLLQGRRVIILVLLAILSAVSMSSLAWLPSDASLWVVLTLVFFAGGTSMASSAVRVVLVAELVGPALTGTAMGIQTTTVQVGILGIAPLFGLIVDRSDSYDLAWWSMAGLAGAGALLLGSVWLLASLLSHERLQ